MAFLERLRSWVNDVLLVAGLWALGLGAVVTAIGKYWPDYAAHVVLAIIGSGFGVVAYVSLQVRRFLKQQAPRVTTRNIETLVRDWCDRLGYGVQRVADAKAILTSRCGRDLRSWLTS